MPPRSAKMKRRIFGFQRRVWWPKWTPASSSSRMETTDIRFLSLGFGRFAGERRVEPAFRRPAPPPGRCSPGRGTKPRKSSRTLRWSAPFAPMMAPWNARRARRRHPEGGLAARGRGGRARVSATTSCRRSSGSAGSASSATRRRSSPSSRAASWTPPGAPAHREPARRADREHAREREALGFAPREIVTEFLLLRRVLWRFVSERAASLDADEVLLVERRLNDTIDRLVAECVVAYFDRATSELAHQAQHDQLTALLNHQAFVREVEAEVERAGPLRARSRPRLLRPRQLQGRQRHARPPGRATGRCRRSRRRSRDRCAPPIAPAGWAATSSPPTSWKRTTRLG